MPHRREEVIVGKDGSIRAIVSPVVERLARKLGTPEIHRASNVEPTAELSQAAKDWICQYLHIDVTQYLPDQPWMTGNWWADLLRQTDGVVLGPFDTREEALAAEETWLRERNIPVCVPCRTQSPSQEETQ